MCLLLLLLLLRPLLLLVGCLVLVPAVDLQHPGDHQVQRDGLLLLLPFGV